MKASALAAVVFASGGLAGCGTVAKEQSSGLLVAGEDWRVETLAETAGGPSALLLDPAGAPSVAYVTPEGLYYAERVGSDWRTQIVARTAAARACAAAWDKAGKPILAYIDGRIPKSARWTGSAWAFLTVDPDPTLHAETLSMASASDGFVHVAFADPDSCVLWQAALREDGWRGEAVARSCEGSARGAEYCSLAAAPDGRPSVAYNYSNGAVGESLRMDLKLAGWNGTEWIPRLVDPDGMGQCPSLAFDAAGAPWVSYTDGLRGALKLARWNGDRWTTGVVDSDESVRCGWSALALDARGTAHVAYLHNESRQIRYATGGGRRWRRSVVESVDEGAGFVSLRLDAAGRPRIAYYDGRAYKYAEPISR